MKTTKLFQTSDVLIDWLENLHTFRCVACKLSALPTNCHFGKQEQLDEHLRAHAAAGHDVPFDYQVDDEQAYAHAFDPRWAAERDPSSASFMVELPGLGQVTRAAALAYAAKIVALVGPPRETFWQRVDPSSSVEFFERAGRFEAA